MLGQRTGDVDAATRANAIRQLELLDRIMEILLSLGGVAIKLIVPDADLGNHQIVPARRIHIGVDLLGGVAIAEWKYVAP